MAFILFSSLKRKFFKAQTVSSFSLITPSYNQAQYSHLGALYMFEMIVVVVLNLFLSLACFPMVEFLMVY